MKSRVDTVNRALILTIGIVLVLLGITAALHSWGALGSARAASPVISDPTARWYRANGSWLWPTVAIICALLLLACLWWVSAQVRTRGTSRIELERERAGSLTVAAGWLADCIEHDASQQDDIDRARARVEVLDEQLHVYLTIWVAAPYDVGRAIAQVTSTVLPHLAVTLDQPAPLPLQTHIQVEAAESTISRLR